jgi:hypothetical protein
LNAQSSTREDAAVPAPAYAGRCFLYILAMAGPEDLLKVGLTGNPLQRWSAFHPRWFEVFDLDHSLLVETETRDDAQALETMLHRRLVDHQCPIPLTMRLAAGGATEWYRGGYSAARHFALEREQAGYVVHLQSRPWLEQAMVVTRYELASMVQQAFEDQCSGVLSPMQLTAIRNLVDSQRSFGADIDLLIPEGIRNELGLQT